MTHQVVDIGVFQGAFEWRLRADEAVVSLGKTPPDMEFFGFAGYLCDRHGVGRGPAYD